MSKKDPLCLLILLFLGSFSSAAVNSIFLSGTNYPSGEYPSAAAVADLNNDRILDIVSANANAHNLSVFLGRADGTFNPAITFAVGAGAVEVASADLNKDGKADLAVTDGIKSVYVAFGNGDGTFGAAVQFTLHTATIGVEIADLNADGNWTSASRTLGRRTIPRVRSRSCSATVTAVSRRRFTTGLTTNRIGSLQSI